MIIFVLLVGVIMATISVWGTEPVGYDGFELLDLKTQHDMTEDMIGKKR